MFCQFDWSPTARIYLQAYKLVKEGLEVLWKSNFTDERGITLIAYGYLTENSILQGFPILSPDILQLCEEILIKNLAFWRDFFGPMLYGISKGGNVQKKIQKLKTK